MNLHDAIRDGIRIPAHLLGLHKKLRTLFGDNYDLYNSGGQFYVIIDNVTVKLGSLRQAMIICDRTIMDGEQDGA